MKNVLKGFFLGVIIMIFLSGSLISVADDGRSAIKVYFDRVKLMVNWNNVEVPTILYEGTTYVPIRAVSEMLDKVVDWDQSTMTANIRVKTSDDISKEVQNQLDAYRVEKSVIEGQANVEVGSTNNPVYWVNDLSTDNEHWFNTITIEETNGIGFTITEIRTTYFTDTEGGHYLKHDADEVKRWFGTNYIKPYGYVSFGTGGNRCATKYEVWTVFGIDDNGNEIQFNNVVEMSQEPVSAHTKEVFKRYYEALEEHDNYDRSKPFVEISFSKEKLIGEIGSNQLYDVCFTEINGIDFSIDTIYRVPVTYHGEANINRYNHIDFNGWWNTDKLNNSELEIGTGYTMEKVLDAIIWIITGHDEDGNTYTFSAVMENEFVSTTTKSEQFDTEILRINANYEVMLDFGVAWVPSNTLGGTRYTLDDIREITKLSPEEKQAKIETLFEALQLYQISEFSNSNQNVRIAEGVYNWEHHQPGYHSVRTNTGECASSAGWLNYILKDDYEEVGFIEMGQDDGSGHVINYIFNDGYYYVIDMTHFRTDFDHGAAVESGLLSDYESGDLIGGIIIKVKNLNDYIQYSLELANDPNEYYGYYQAEDVPPIDGHHNGNSVVRVYPFEMKEILHVIYDNPDDQMSIGYVTAPKKTFDYWMIDSFEFE